MRRASAVTERVLQSDALARGCRWLSPEATRAPIANPSTRSIASCNHPPNHRAPVRRCLAALRRRFRTGACSGQRPRRAASLVVLTRLVEHRAGRLFVTAARTGVISALVEAIRDDVEVRRLRELSDVCAGDEPRPRTSSCPMTASRYAERHANCRAARAGPRPHIVSGRSHGHNEPWDQPRSIPVRSRS